MITEKQIDIFDSGAEVFIHQCNCQNTMGSGIAKLLRDKWPEVYEIDCFAQKSGTNRLGEISIVTIKTIGINDPKFVINCYSQFYYGHGKRYTNYEAFYKCLEKVREYCMRHNIKTIAAPFKMGCNLAGGDWRIVRQIFEVVFENVQVEVIICRKDV